MSKRGPVNFSCRFTRNSWLVNASPNPARIYIHHQADPRRVVDAGPASCPDVAIHYSPPTLISYYHLSTGTHLRARRARKRTCYDICLTDCPRVRATGDVQVRFTLSRNTLATVGNRIPSDRKSKLVFDGIISIAASRDLVCRMRCEAFLSSTENIRE